MGDNEEKINKEKSDTENQTNKKTDITRDLTADVPTMKSLGLGGVDEITRNMDRLRDVSNRDLGLGFARMTEATRQLNQFNLPKFMGLGGIYRELDSPFSQLTKLYAENRFVNHANAAQAVMSSSIFHSLKPFQLANELKVMGAGIPFREITSKINVLRNSSIPHMSFYRGILDMIDEGTYNRMTEELIDDEEIEAEEDDEAEEATVIRPECLNVALTINMYVTVTENHVQSSPDVTEEEKTAWMKVGKPILYSVMGVFLSWAFSSTMDGMMELFKPLEKIAEISEEYQYPVETTEVEDLDLDLDVKHEP